MLKTLQEKAVEKYVEAQDGASFDPAVIAVIFELVMQLIAALQDCAPNAADAVGLCHNPTFLQRLVLNRKIRRELGRQENRLHGDDVYVALLETGKTVTEEELAEAFGEL